jgi:RNA polymerase sigma-70 factor (ECF subfamily)
VHQEENLVQQAVCGDQQAFALLYEANFDRIYRYVYLKIGDKAEAEDMTQQVFLHALRSITTYKWQGTPFTAWLFRIAHNQVVDHLRRKARRPITIEINETIPTTGGDPEYTTEKVLDMERLSHAIQRLTKAQREVISLRFAGGLSIDEVAKAMGKRPGAIKALQHAAVVALRRLLRVEEDDKVPINS